MIKYVIKRFRKTNNEIYLDLYNESAEINFELTFRHYGKIKTHYKEISKIFSRNQFNHVSMNIFEIILMLERTKLEINSKEVK